MIGWVWGCLQCYPHPVFRHGMQGYCFYITYSYTVLVLTVNCPKISINSIHLTLNFFIYYVKIRTNITLCRFCG
jgi:uncharacterized protein with PQ loop repeat